MGMITTAGVHLLDNDNDAYNGGEKDETIEATHGAEGGRPG